MTALTIETLKLKTESCRILRDSWLTWRGSSLIPRHDDVDPGAIRSILPAVGIIDVRSKGTAIFRLAGSGLRDIFGFDPTGQNAIERVPESYRNRRAYRLYVPAVTPCGYLGESHFVYRESVTDLFESVGLPLQTSDPGSLNMVIFTMESLQGRHWEKKHGHMIENPVNTLNFVDVGAGAPSAEPPEDFLTT